MWRETNVLGILFPPLLVYMVVALLLWMPLRAIMLRMRLGRWLETPAIAYLTVYLCVLAALVTWL